MSTFVQRTVILSLLLAAAQGGLCQEAAQADPVQMPSTELRKFRSGILERDLLLYVQLPLDFDPGADRTYPVVYATDGNRSFPMVANISTVLGFPPAGFPRVIVVGIAYDMESMSDWASLRTLDLTPTVNRETEQYWEGMLGRMTGDSTIRVRTGGAPDLLECIRRELIPFMEKEYPVRQDDRALFGYSYGGLFGMYVLFHNQGTFRRIFAGSPSLHYDREVLFGMEEAYSAANTDLDVKLFLTAGSLEEYTAPAVRRMLETLVSRDYPNLEVKASIIPDEDHRSAYPASVMKAFTWLYGRAPE